MLALQGCIIFDKKEENPVYEYEQKKYNRLIEVQKFTLSSDLCVIENDVNELNFNLSEDISGAALFNLTDKKVLYGHHLFERVYPASITKIMTALLLIENADLEENITITAEAVNFPSYAVTCGLHVGDQIKLKDLLYGLLLPSGNDAAAAIAIYLDGSIEGFANRMNERASNLVATGTHFVSPHGLHDDNHYTTPYDLYIIFNECIKHPEFVEAISTPYYSSQVLGNNGVTRTLDFATTNLYLKGSKDVPGTIIMDGGKTGTTNEAMNCLILLTHNKENTTPYISMILGASTKDAVYQNMSGLYEAL